MNLNFLKGVNNQHLDLARMGWALSILAGIGYSGFHLVAHNVFNIIEFGTGMGALLAAGGGAVAVKDTYVAKANATATGEQ